MIIMKPAQPQLHYKAVATLNNRQIKPNKLSPKRKQIVKLGKAYVIRLISFRGYLLVLMVLTLPVKKVEEDVNLKKGRLLGMRECKRF